MQQKRVGVKAIVVVGLAWAVGWALASPRVWEQQPPLEIPLYEGAQIEWEVQLTAQEMGAQLAQWAQELSVLKISGYTIAGERALEVLNFYDQALSQWRRIFWAQPSESGGARIFAHEQSYLFIGISKKHEATELILATGQTDETTLDVPIFEGAELQWEILLTKQDLLEHLKRWVAKFLQNPPFPRTPSWESQQLANLLAWFVWVGGDMAFEVFQDLSELRAVGYKLDGNKAPEVLSFYEQQFSEWRRNFWAKPSPGGGLRIFTNGGESGLNELVVFSAWQSYEAGLHSWGEEQEEHPPEITEVLVLRARR
uniref:Uncharacterized protein n=1 Tax=Acetithermum autotrophicum TaxID=1446466 RepID=H5SRR1_ACEAU|nr:hypothetical protein HGMM_OP3C002 [Candidatus Acetothermum autotrophicum]